MAEPRHRPAILRLSGRHLDIRDLNEVVALLERHHCNKASYHRLGLSLLLSHNTLEKVEQEHRGQVDRCFTESLASWLRKADSVENPTLDTLIAALRGIGENAVADGITGERQRDPMQPGMTYNPGVRDLELKINEVSGLQEIAYKLQGQFDSLVLAVKKSLESHCNNIEDAKVLIKGCLKRKARVVAELMFCIDKLGEVNDFKSFFEFLSDYDFIGYLNYKLLKKLIVEFAKDDDEIKDRFIGYEEEYVKLLSAASFQNFIPFFEKNSDLSPTAPLGLPLISFRLEKPWLITSILTWVSTYGAFSWLEYAYLKQLRAGSIIITYAILPCVLDDVMRDLKNPVILRKLKDNDITVIELPQEEEETQLESTAKRKLISTGVTPIEKEFIIKNSSLGRELISSIEFHTKPEEVIGLLEAGADPNATEYASDRNTALIRAIDKNNIGIVKFLLEKGADPNIGSDTRKRTPLLIAVKNGSIETVDILLTNGARTDVVSKDGKTPLHYAGKSGKVEMLEFWISRGDYDVNVKDKRKRTPLFNAVKSGSIEAVDFLLTNGASTDVVDIAGTTPLHCAGKSGKVEMLEFWIKRGDYDVNVKDKRKRTPLFNAVKSGSIEAVNILLTNGARADVVSKDGKTLLHCAGESGEVEMLQFWIKKGDYNVNVKDERKRTPLFNAVKKGSIEAVDVLLTNGATTDVVDKDKETLLHCAGESGKVEMLEFWIKRGDNDVNVKNKRNKTPLFNAVSSGSIEAVDILLTNGARTDVVDKYDITPLHCASETGDSKIIKLLITKGKADVNAVDEDKKSPLFNAVKSGSIEAVDILLTNGARTDVVDKDGKTLLHCAGESGKVEMLEFWRGDYDVNVKDKRKRTPLFNAVESGSIEVIDILLTNGAKTDIVNEHDDSTPLHSASETGSSKIINLLITKGKADVNAVDEDNKTPLLNAVKNGSIETVDILLTNGARADIVSKDGETLLHCAGESGKVEMLEFWIKRGDYDVNVKNKRKRTPLFNAVKSGSIEAVDILLTNGARTDVVDKNDCSTPLHCASQTGNCKIIKLLITKGKASVNVMDKRRRTPLFTAVKKGNIEAVDILLTNGARTDVVDKDGETLLHCASESGEVEMLEFWIKRGDTDVNVKDKKNETPLFSALNRFNSSVEAVDILLTNGARTDVVDKYDDTPLHCASETGNSKIIKLLITKGKADVNVVDKNKKTPLFNAVKSGSIEAVDILLTNGARTDVVDEDGETLLHCASESGEVEMLEFWISRGDYDVNVKDKRNRTPLFNALDRFNSSVEAVDILLTNGASTDVMDADDDSTPLHCASETGNCKIIKLLITKGKADVNAVDEKNRTPLFNAVEKGSIEAVNILLANGARTDVVSKDGKTLLHCAGESGEVEMLEFWIKKGDYDVNVKDEENKTPLFSALSRFNSSVEAVDILLTNGASTDVVDTSYSGTTPLHCAIETGSSKIIKLLITKGKADVNAVDKNNRTPLFKAVKKGNIQAVDILLTNGARTDVVDKDGETLLHCASESGEVEMLEFWIKKGDCDVNVKDERNRTPLFSALERFNSSVEAVDILLTNGAKTDVVDEHDDSTPLHCASETGDSKIIELLITKGEADVNAVDKKNRTPLFNAVKEGSIEAVEVLLTNGARTDVVDKDGETLLHCASESNEVEMLEFWIKRGDYDVNVTNKRNRTPLFNALDKYRCSIEAVDILLNNGARTDVVDTDDDSTPLHCASETGNSEIIKLLITKGKADVNAVDEDNKTPLFNAVKKGSIEVVEILLTNGAKTDVVDKDGETLLHCAAESGKVEMLEFWIKRGDHDVNAKDKRNRTPLFNALVKYRCSIEVVDILLTNGARTDVADTSAFDGSTPLHCAIQTGNSKIIKLLVTKGKADVNVVDEWKRTPLFKAVKKGNIEAVDILLTNGAKTDVVDKYGETLLHCAAESGKIEMLKFWIKRGDYDVNVLDKKKRTPLFNAVKEGSIEAVDILLTNGARTDVVDKDGETLLQCAGRSGNAEMLEFWISKRSKTNVADNLGALLKEFEGKVTREQAAAIYKSSGFSSDASMKCLKEGPTLESILSMLNQKMESAKSVVVTVHTDDMWRDIVRHYKSGSVDFGERLFIKLSNTLAIDAGGVRRQVYSTVYNEFHCNKHIELFTGPLHSLSPACTAEARSSGLFKILGSMVGHSIWQDGIGFPFFSLTNYTYIVEGEEKALQVCSDNDIGAGVAAVISKLQDIKTEDDGKEVMKDELILDIISRCGVTMIPNPSTKNIIVQDIITYEALFKHSKLLDQFVEGLKATSLYPLLRAFPALFQPLFTFTELTSEEVQKSLIFPNEDSFIAQESIILRYLKKYIDECDSEGLKEFALSITGRISVLPKSIEIKFEADRMGTIATHSCSGELIFPCQFEGDYEMFCSALKSVLTRDFNTY